MHPSEVQPRTILGIKSLAKDIKKHQGIPHTKALDIAAQRAGYQNYAHAFHAIPCQQPRYLTFITAYWRDATYRGGRETIAIHLHRPWNQSITQRHFGLARGLKKFRGQSPDHVVSQQLVGEQWVARNLVCAAARTLLFIDATGLQPARFRTDRFVENWSRDPCPGMDHISSWIDARSRVMVLANEPYQGKYSQNADAQAAWVTRKNLHLVRPNWRGMYRPDLGSHISLITEDEELAKRLRESLHTSLMLPVEDPWQGESGEERPLFRSPGELGTGQRVRAPRDPADLRPSKTTLPCGWSQRRPRGLLPIEAHTYASGLIREVDQLCGNRRGVVNRLDVVRAALSTWACEEHLGSKVDFDAIYYNQAGYSKQIPLTLTQSQRDTATHCILRLVETLTQHYPESEPRRTIFRNLSLALRSLNQWKQKKQN